MHQIHLSEPVILTIKILGVFLCATIISWFINKLFSKIIIHLEQTKSHWDDTFFKALKPIAMFFIFIFGIYLSLEIIFNYINFDQKQIISSIKTITLILLLYIVLMRYIKNIKLSLELENRKNVSLDQSTREFIIKIIQIILTIVMVLTVLQNLGISISGLLAFGGVGGLAVGLAAKDMLANLFGGLTIHMDRPFIIGDKISMQDKKIEGFVKHIGWRQTKILGYDRTPIYVPNAIFTNIAVINPSRMENRRINFIIGLRYQDLEKIERISLKITEFLKKHDAIDQNRDALAKFSDYGSSSLNILIRCFTMTTNWNNYIEIKHEILLKIGKIVHNYGADFAFPTQTLNMEDSLRVKMESNNKDF